MKINDKEYLEIRMNDMSTIYYHAKPISYIYERLKSNLEKLEKMKMA